MPDYTQDDRPYRLTTPLGANELLLVSWEGEERVSSLFRFVVEAWSARSDIGASELLLKPVSMSLRMADGSDRKISGIVNRLSLGGDAPTGYTSYRLEIVPKIWMLTLDSGFDVFQEMSSKAIIDKLLTGYDVTWQTQREFEPRPYFIRYRESIWTCVSRLMEEEGIWYRFDHSVDGAKLVIADAPPAAQVAWNVQSLSFTNNKNELEGLMALRSDSMPYIARTEVRTYSEFMVTSDISDGVNAIGTWHPPSTLHHYVFDQEAAAHRSGITPGGGERNGDPPKLHKDVKVQSRLRQQVAESTSFVVTGKGSYVGLQSGAKVEVKNHPIDAFNDTYFVLSVRHRGSNGSYLGGDNVAPKYDHEFTAIPLKTPYRPPRSTPWPRVAGTHVGVVVGPAGEEIFTDKYGRVQVAFRWDQGNKPDLTRSCWMRVVQSFAGQGFGSVYLPRIGHEVLIEFLDGNPDNPVVVGSLYNSANLPPWALPANKTQSGVRTHSSLQGSTDNYNEVRFEDKKGEEQINVQAEKNLDTLVKNDETRKVGHSRTTTIHYEDTKTVEEFNDNTYVKKGKQIIKVEASDRELTVAQNQTVSIGADHKITVGGKQVEQVKGDEEVEIKGKETIKVDGNTVIEVQQGTMTLETKVGGITVKSPMSIKLVVGANSIEITPAGVTIKGTMVKVEGTAMAQVKAPMTQVNGDGMLTLKGGVTMIN